MRTRMQTLRKCKYKKWLEKRTGLTMKALSTMASKIILEPSMIIMKMSANIYSTENLKLMSAMFLLTSEMLKSNTQ